METIIKAIDKAVRAGVYTLEETSILLNELNSLKIITDEVKKYREIREKKLQEEAQVEKDKQALVDKKIK